jgi:hypothetical protein
MKEVYVVRPPRCGKQNVESNSTRDIALSMFAPLCGQQS